jgi:hypothetical protein
MRLEIVPAELDTLDRLGPIATLAASKFTTTVQAFLPDYFSDLGSLR